MDNLIQILLTEHGQGFYYNSKDNNFCVDGLLDDYITVNIRSFLKTLDGTHVRLCEAFLPWVQKHIGKLRTERHAPEPAEPPVTDDVVIGAGVPARQWRAEAGDLLEEVR
jgi:hypothetical protein